MSKAAIPQKDSPKYWNRLYHQKPDGTFEDVTEKAGLAGAGYSTGVAVGDYDNDGYEDIFVAGFGGNALYHNNGDGTFTDITAKAGVAGSGWSTSAAWIDYDNDGLLDLVVARYMEWDFADIFCGDRRQGYQAYCHHVYFEGYKNACWANFMITVVANQRNAVFAYSVKRIFDYTRHKTGLDAITLLHSCWGVCFFDFYNGRWKDLVVAQAHVMDTIKVN